MRAILLSIAILCSANVFAEEPTIALAKANVDLSDKASIKRGAKFFGTVCIACHTLIYMQYDPIAKEAGITLERMPINVKKWPLDVKPPDLSLETDVRGADWIYTYLHSFYMDKTRPTGANNLLFPNAAMSYILASYQGVQTLVSDPKDSRGIYDHALQWYDALELQSQGTMTPTQFDETVRDVVNFLAYSAEPYHEKQKNLGVWVLGFLFILFIFTYLLKKEYWRDIKKDK